MNEQIISLAERLTTAGIPVIYCPAGTPGNGSEMYMPKGWQKVGTPEPGKVWTAQGWQPLAAIDLDRGCLAMVAGHGLDVLDIDSKHDGSPDHLPGGIRTFGTRRTPSGGWHLLVTSTGFPRIESWQSEAGFLGDYLGGRQDGSSRALAFIGGHRNKYPGLSYSDEGSGWDVEGAMAADPDPVLSEFLGTCSSPARPTLSDEEREALRAAASNVDEATARGGADVPRFLDHAERVIVGGQRNKELFKAAMRAINSGHGFLLADLEIIASKAGLGQAEIDQTFRSARDKAAKEGQPEALWTEPWEAPEVSEEDVFAAAEEMHGEKAGTAPRAGVLPPALPEAFWSLHPRLALVREIALARLAPPDATLLNVLARVACTMGPEFALPSVLGADQGSMNAFVMPVGKSGGGKALSVSVSRFLVPDDELHTQPLGSGEGILSAYHDWQQDLGATGKKQTVYKRVRDRALLHDAEGSVLKTLAERKGATLNTTLLKAAHGQEIGSSNSNRDRSKPTVTMKAGTYRLSLILEIQPDLLGFLMELRSSGLPQRFVMLSAYNPHADARNLRPLSHFQKEIGLWTPPVTGLMDGVDVPDWMQLDIADRSAQWMASMSEDPEEEMKSQRSRLVLWVAAAIGAWCRPGDMAEVTEADYAAANLLLDTHYEMQAWVYRRGLHRAAAAGRRRTEEAVHREKKVAAVRDKVKSAARTIARKVAKHANDRTHGEAVCTRKCATTALRSDYREVIDEALSHAESMDWIEVEEQGDGLRITPGGSAPK